MIRTEMAQIAQQISCPMESNQGMGAVTAVMVVIHEIDTHLSPPVCAWISFLGVLDWRNELLFAFSIDPPNKTSFHRPSGLFQSLSGVAKHHSLSSNKRFALSSF